MTDRTCLSLSNAHCAVISTKITVTVGFFSQENKIAAWVEIWFKMISFLP